MILFTVPYTRNAVNSEGFKPKKKHKVLGIIEPSQNCGFVHSLGLSLFLSSLLKKVISIASTVISFISAPDTNA